MEEPLTISRLCCILYQKKIQMQSIIGQKKRWDNYFEIISTKFDSKNGNYLGYGLKIFPDR